MKSISDLTDFYYKNLFPTLERLEADRKSLRHKIIIIGSVYTIIAALTAYELSNYLDFIAFAYFALGAIIYKFLVHDYTHEFKMSVIKPLVHAIDNSLLYSSKTHVSEYLFNHSDLFSEPDKMSGNDYVKGSIDDISIQFSDIHAEKRNRNSKGKDSWSTIFKGLFIVSEFNKKFEGKTVVLPDSAQSTFGNLIGNWLQSKNMARD